MKLRKHIRADILRIMYEEVQMGVPVARSMAKHIPEGEMTRPTVAHLIKAYEAVEDPMNDLATQDRIASSIFPVWLDPMQGVVQEQPYNYDYEGRFPRGRYVCRT